LALLERFDAVDLATKGKEAGTAILGFINSALEGWAQLQRGVLLFQAGVSQIAGVTSEIVNVAWDGIQRVMSLGNTFIAAMAEGVAALALDAQTGFQFAFQHVVRFFDTHMGGVIDNIAAALEFAIQKSIEGISKIPILGKQ